MIYVVTVLFICYAMQAKDYGRCVAAKVPEIEHNMCSKEFLALRACMHTAVIYSVIRKKLAPPTNSYPIQMEMTF